MGGVLICIAVLPTVCGPNRLVMADGILDARLRSHWLRGHDYIKVVERSAACRRRAKL